MKKALAIIIAALFVFALTSVSFAAEKKAAPAPVEKKEAAPAKAEEKAMEKKAPVKIKQVTGEVTAVDTTAMAITVSKKVKGKAVETVATVDDKTRIMMGKEKKTLADVKAGDKVTVHYKEVDGKNVAKSVAIKPAEAMEKKAKKKAAKKAEPAMPAEQK
jgi:ribosomal protein S1